MKKRVEDFYEGKRNTPDSRRFKAILLSAMFYAVDVQLKDDNRGFRLDVSDKTLADLCGISTRQAKRVRLTLAEMGIIFFPAWSKQKKAGDYPMWLVDFEYMTFTDEPKKVRAAAVNQKYEPFYYQLKNLAQKEVYEMLSEYYAVITMKTFMMLTYKALDEKLKELGIEKESLLRKKS